MASPRPGRRFAAKSRALIAAAAAHRTMVSMAAQRALDALLMHEVAERTTLVMSTTGLPATLSPATASTQGTALTPIARTVTGTAHTVTPLPTPQEPRSPRTPPPSMARNSVAAVAPPVMARTLSAQNSIRRSSVASAEEPSPPVAWRKGRRGTQPPPLPLGEQLETSTSPMDPALLEGRHHRPLSPVVSPRLRGEFGAASPVSPRLMTVSPRMTLVDDGVMVEPPVGALQLDALVDDDGCGDGLQHGTPGGPRVIRRQPRSHAKPTTPHAPVLATALRSETPRLHSAQEEALSPVHHRVVSRDKARSVRPAGPSMVSAAPESPFFYRKQREVDATPSPKAGTSARQRSSVHGGMHSGRARTRDSSLCGSTSSLFMDDEGSEPFAPGELLSVSGSAPLPAALSSRRPTPVDPAANGLTPHHGHSHSGNFRLSGSLCRVSSTSTNRDPPGVLSSRGAQHYLSPRSMAANDAAFAQALALNNHRTVVHLDVPLAAATQMVDPSPPLETPGASRQMAPRRAPAGPQPRKTAPALGAKLRDAAGGREVVSVTEGGNAHQAGVRKGDVIVTINGRRVASKEQTEAALERARTAGRLVRIGVSRFVTPDAATALAERTVSRSSTTHTSASALRRPHIVRQGSTAFPVNSARSSVGRSSVGSCGSTPAASRSGSVSQLINLSGSHSGVVSAQYGYSSPPRELRRPGSVRSVK